MRAPRQPAAMGEAAVGLLVERGEQRGIPLDPRTKLFVVLVVSGIMIAGDGRGALAVVQPVLAVVPALFFVLMGRFSVAAKYACAYAAAKIIPPLVIACSEVGVLVMAAGIVGALGRLLPGFLMGYFLVATTTVSEFIAAAERLRLPRCLTIPLSVMFRFFPTVVVEYRAISDAMRMRGIEGLKSPVAMLEYRLVPLLMSMVVIGNELAASALCRGLGSPRRRTNVCEIGFHGPDAVAFALGALCLPWLVVSLMR